MAQPREERAASHNGHGTDPAHPGGYSLFGTSTMHDLSLQPLAAAGPSCSSAVNPLRSRPPTAGQTGPRAARRLIARVS